MGLAASQARLLTITSRKSRAQFDSMRYSHQKLALSRSLTNLSNEYQNALDQTKLYYDFYGVNSTDNALTYNLLMSASAINNYTPTLISNNQGQIVLSPAYAAAAKAAGIPQEGLSCTPSSIMRNAFINSLAENGIITGATALSIQEIDYNIHAGLGTDNLVNVITEVKNYDELLDELANTKELGNILFNSIYQESNTPTESPSQMVLCDSTNAMLAYCGANTGNLFSNTDDEEGGDITGTYTNGNDSREKLGNLVVNKDKNIEDISFKDLLEGNYYLSAELATVNPDVTYDNNIISLLQGIQAITEKFGEVLGSNVVGSEEAIAYANSQMFELAYKYTLDGNNVINNVACGVTEQAYIDKNTPHNNHVMQSNYFGEREVDQHDYYWSSQWATDHYLGVAVTKFNDGRSSVIRDKNRAEAVASVNVSDFLNAWFTYYMQSMQGFGSEASNQLNVKWGQTPGASIFAKDSESTKSFQFITSSTEVAESEALTSTFYDTLFNQICLNGWSENAQVAKDSNYLKEMLQNGMMYITSMADDCYYYQNNYATNSFIKEVSDDSAVAAAEAKYSTEKARINAKEQEIDLKMKNLDTEISALQTEYDAVKKVIETNTSKAFTRYES